MSQAERSPAPTPPEPSCASCAHYDLVVIPPMLRPVAQCWSPDDDIVGAWYWYQWVFGDGSLLVFAQAASAGATWP